LGHELGVRVPLSIWVYEGVHVHAYEEKEEDYIKRRKKACFLNLWSLPVLANLQRRDGSDGGDGGGGGGVGRQDAGAAVVETVKRGSSVRRQ